jgi:hypothetical protein
MNVHCNIFIYESWCELYVYWDYLGSAWYMDVERAIVMDGISTNVIMQSLSAGVRRPMCNVMYWADHNQLVDMNTSPLLAMF